MKLVNKKLLNKRMISVLVILFILFGSTGTAWASGDSGTDVLPEIRSLLQNAYVDPVSSEVLNAPTIDETLKRLGDPHTMYFSPEEYQNFINSMDMRFSGIGIHIEMVPEGVKIISVIPNSPAEDVGLQEGDIIIAAGGQSLAGLSSEQAVVLLRGPEGSSVQITVVHGASTLQMNVTRRAIEEATVIGEVMDGHIGVVKLRSFGSNTPTEFQSVVNRLRSSQVDAWIVDLRNNPGGYLSSAIDLAGYFIGKDRVVQIKDRAGIVYQYEATDHGFTLNQPIIFLTNENSASASEILSAAVKDHQKATLVGTTTYGKGTVQSMFPLSNGGVLKMTVDHFYSPFGHEINKVGVTPDLPVQQAADALKVAEFMLGETANTTVTGADTSEVMRWTAPNHSVYTLSLTKARTPDDWAAWGEILNTATPGTLEKGSSTGWHTITDQEKADRYPLYYPGYQKISELSDIPLDKKFTVHFAGHIDWQSVTNDTLELINSLTGERIPTTFEPQGSSDVRVIPTSELKPDTTYWIVIHSTIHDVFGRALQAGTLAVAHTVQGNNAGTSSIQSVEKVPKRYLIDPIDGKA